MVEKFWAKVIYRKNKLYKSHLKLNPRTILLNSITETELPFIKPKAIAILMSAAKSAIASKWRDSNGSTLTLWHQMAKLNFSSFPIKSDMQFSAFCKQWSLLMEYLAQFEDYKVLVY